MASKTWTATDVEQHRLYLMPPDGQGDIVVQRDYWFVDSGGNRLFDRTEVLQASVPFAGLPINIKSALQAINDWTKNQILQKEGMT